MQETRFDFGDRKIPWRRDRLPTPVFLDFPGSSYGEVSACTAGGLGSQRGCGLLKDACRGLSQGSRQPGTAGGHRLVFPGGSAGKESACNEGDPGSIPGP